MRFVLFVIFTIIASPLFAQVPEPAMLSLKYIGGNYGDGVANTVVYTNDGGFIITIGTNSTYGTGSIDSFCSLNGSRSIFIKYDINGTQEWTKCFQWPQDTFFYYIFPEGSGGFVGGGMYSSVWGWGIYICEQDASGNIVWSRGYSKGNSLQMGAMIATDDGGFLISAYSYYTDTNATAHYGSWMDPDILLLKVDANGNKVWAKVMGGSGTDDIASIVKGPNGSYYLSGYTSSNDHDCTGNHGNGDVYLVRIDKDGNIMWHRDLGGSKAEDMAYMTTDGGTGIVLATYSFSDDGNVTGHIGSKTDQNIWAVNVDSNGNVVWDKCYGGSGSYVKSICRATDGSIWLAGVTNKKYGQIDTAYGGSDAWIVHANANGNFINAKVLGSHLEDRGMLICPLSDGKVFVGGEFDTSDGTFCVNYGGEDAFVAEFAPWNQTGVSNVKIKGMSVSIYPNPVSGKLRVDCSKKSLYSATVTNITGTIMHISSFRQSEEIDTEQWPKGTYYLRLSAEEGVEVHMLVVQ